VLVVIPQAASMVIVGTVVQLGPDAAWIVQRRLVAQLVGARRRRRGAFILR
jgi:hypothetical protein